MAEKNIRRRLSDLIDALQNPVVAHARDIEINSIASDSRRVQQGDLFVAVRGLGVDGHDFIDAAVDRGAVCVVSEKEVDRDDVVTVRVDDSARALARLASRYYGDPAHALRMFGVTGTNGKTSTAHLFRAIRDRAHVGNTGILGTIGHGVGGDLQLTAHTTPDPLTLHRLLYEMLQKKCSGVVMEVSSHAVTQQRTCGIDFDMGMLTNITRDHLDYHSSFDDYVAAKREFCESLVAKRRRKPDGTLVYSIDNSNSRTVGEGFTGSKMSTSIERDATVFADEVDASIDGTRFTLHLSSSQSVKIQMRLLGRFSVANATLAAAAASAIGIDAKAIKQGIESVARVPGRFEALGGDSKPVVVVDYSHTPDSLERTLTFCRGLDPRRLIVVFGCGGDRDRGKRPLMGEIAQREADLCFVTSDNPRTEDPMKIIDDILEGMDRNDASLVVNVDRREAISQAVACARAGDLVAVCGKGHEDYQIIGKTRHHFDDREEATNALARWQTT